MVVLKELTQILGLFQRPAAAGQPANDSLTAPLMACLIDLRARLRKEKNFGLADEIRKRLTELGVTLEDRCRRHALAHRAQALRQVTECGRARHPQSRGHCRLGGSHSLPK